MTRTDDLLTRLATADPVATADAPTAEEERQAAQLLERVLASPAHEQPARAPSRRRPLLVRRGLVGAAFAATLAVALVLVLSPSQRSFADRAYAAVTAPELFHVVVRSSHDIPDLGAAPGERREAGTVETQAWYDTAAPAFHTVHRVVRGDRDVLLADEAAGDQNGIVARSGDEPPSPIAEIEPDGSTKDVFPERFDPTAKTKAALRDPDIREDGEVTVDGRRARRLVIDVPDQPAVGPSPAVVDATQIVLIDAETLYPIEFREQAFFVREGVREQISMVTRYTTFETLPRTPENLRLLKMGARP